MSQKSSVPQAAKSVSQVLMSDNREYSFFACFNAPPRVIPGVGAFSFASGALFIRASPRLAPTPKIQNSARL